MKSVAILGTSDLGKKLNEVLSTEYNVSIYSRAECNFMSQTDIEQVAKQIKDADYIINTVGVLEANAWDTFITNTVAPLYLLEMLQDLGCTSHVINVSSHAATWTSWPGASIQRLWYNNSKKALGNSVIGLSHSRASKMRLSVFNPSRFESKMSNYSGHSINTMVDSIVHIMQHAPLVYEVESPDV